MGELLIAFGLGVLVGSQLVAVPVLRRLRRVRLEAKSDG